ncbi:hypothetical protein HETIRDRAFT_122905 [Heterobasidion irregulare TC 32-1]|uniref:U6 snRNA phosphodiesterase 1 n=1 Tax=Heterobasidion irregulare (strain TC 32-1) TaxID=747525 RepID=W4KAI2_HETIT|nr:uncharacterized protein HETIRDRAFT_122905 [Heterobasidion irregulare TC 32-1]ETW82096.1 hypothetical protein HETIRDRAFT_122905 [Heterobasidion irregulare TC 32-1]
MKRVSLVAYSDSDSDAVDDSPAPPNKKHKLPPLPSHLVVPVPSDDPSKHQGRTRTTPHVDGQWAAYVYVPVAIAALDHRPLRALVRRLLARAKEAVPSLQPLAASERQQLDAGRAVEGDSELHISLSRPIFIRSHQREDVKRAVKSLASAHCPFAASFAALAALTNDEHTRTFLCMEVGAGHLELRALSDALSPLLRALRQKEYYDAPRFHASIAWALLDPPTQPSRPQIHHDDPRSSASPALAPPPSIPPAASTALALSSHTSHTPSASPPQPASDSATPSPPPPPFPTIPRLPPTLVPSLSAEFGNELAARAGVFHVGEVKVRIGKDVFAWPLR